MGSRKIVPGFTLNPGTILSDHGCLELPTWENVAAKAPETEESSRAGNYFEKGGRRGGAGSRREAQGKQRRNGAARWLAAPVSS